MSGRFSYLAGVCKRFNSTQAALARLRESRHPTQFDFISPTNAQLLDLTLSPYLGYESQPASADFKSGQALRPGYHLVYFPERVPESKLAADGYNTSQSPGGDFVRRMWAGGSVEFSKKESLPIGSEAMCEEHIEKVDVKGTGEDEKIFVWTERLMSSASRPWAVREKRCIVYMRERKHAPPPKLLKRKSIPNEYIHEKHKPKQTSL